MQKNQEKIRKWPLKLRHYLFIYCSIVNFLHFFRVVIQPNWRKSWSWLHRCGSRLPLRFCACSLGRNCANGYIPCPPPSCRPTSRASRCPPNWAARSSWITMDGWSSVYPPWTPPGVPHLYHITVSNRDVIYIYNSFQG